MDSPLLRTVMERCEKIGPETYLPRPDCDGTREYNVPSPPERDVGLTQADLEEYTRSYQDPTYTQVHPLTSCYHVVDVRPNRAILNSCCLLICPPSRAQLWLTSEKIFGQTPSYPATTNYLLSIDMVPSIDLWWSPDRKCCRKVELVKSPAQKRPYQTAHKIMKNTNRDNRNRLKRKICCIYWKDGKRLESQLTQEELEQYSRAYDEASLRTVHQTQASYAQSEGYHSYVSSTDSTTTTPFLDRLRRESEAARVEGHESSSSGSSSETLKWHGSMSDVSSTGTTPLIAHSAKVQTPQRHHSESVLYLSQLVRHNQINNQRKLFPVSTYTVQPCEQHSPSEFDELFGPIRFLKGGFYPRVTRNVFGMQRIMVPRHPSRLSPYTQGYACS
ncbi:melanosome organization [Homalodisca vitripennis]|nr:melanosome organization [Homalodisca vitripennis]